MLNRVGKFRIILRKGKNVWSGNKLTAPINSHDNTRLIAAS